MIFINKHEDTIIRSFKRPIREINIVKLHSFAGMREGRFIVFSTCTKLRPIQSDCYGKRVTKEHNLIKEPNKVNPRQYDALNTIRNYPMLNKDKLDDASLPTSR